jgi:hypothetical protein
MKTEKYPQFGRKEDRVLFSINKNENDEIINPIAIFELKCLSNLEIAYNYSVEENTHEHADFIKISKAEFLRRVKETQKRYGVKFTIKY